MVATMAWMPMTRPGNRRRPRRRMKNGKARDQCDRKQDRGDPTEPGDSHCFATRGSAQRQQQRGKSGNAKKGVQSAEQPSSAQARYRRVGARMASPPPSRPVTSNRPNDNDSMAPVVGMSRRIGTSRQPPSRSPFRSRVLPSGAPSRPSHARRRDECRGGSDACSDRHEPRRRTPRHRTPRRDAHEHAAAECGAITTPRCSA